MNSARSSLVALTLLSTACAGHDDYYEGDHQIESTTQEINNGVPLGSSYRSYMAHTVRIRTATGGTCTGTLLRNNMVLTARHCATNTGSITGTLVTNFSNMAVATPPSPTVPNVNCVGSAANKCSTVQSVVQPNFGVVAQSDILLLVLTTPITAMNSNNTWGHMVPLDPFAPSTHQDASRWVSGYGNNTTNASGTDVGAGTLREGVVTIVSTTSGPSNTSTRVGTFYQAQGNIPMGGDSGGPYWSRSTRPDAVFAVHNSRKTNGSTPTAYGLRVADHRAWIRTALDDNTSFFTTLFNSSSDINKLEKVEASQSTHGTTSWSTASNGSGLFEASNFYDSSTYKVGSMQVFKTPVYHNVRVEAKFTTTDNDAFGLVFRMLNSKVYYRFSVDRQRKFANITKFNWSEREVLVEKTNYTVPDASSGLKLQVLAEGNRLRAAVGDSWILDVRDDDIPVGRVGIYEWGTSPLKVNWFRTGRRTSDSPSF